jgi:hypothetical protein
VIRLLLGSGNRGQDIREAGERQERGRRERQEREARERGKRERGKRERQRGLSVVYQYRPEQVPVISAN